MCFNASATVGGTWDHRTVDDRGNSGEHRWALAEAEQAVAYATLRCRPTLALIETVADVSSVEHYLSVKVLRERSSRLTLQERQQLMRALTDSLSESYRASLPANLRPRTDRLLSNVGDAVLIDDARSLCGTALTSRLKARRLAATKLLRRIGVHHDLLDQLRLAVVSFRDIHALELLCRLPGGLAGMNCCEILDLERAKLWSAPDTYLGGLVLARLWSDGCLDHDHAAHKHAVPYLRALGRTGDLLREGLALDIIESTVDPEALKMGASVFGRLGSMVGVEAVGRRCRELLATADINDAESDESRLMPAGAQ